MKKISTLLVTALFAATVGATDYTGPLSVSLGGQTMPSGETTVSMTENEDGSCNLVLKNFSFMGMPVGNIKLESAKENKYSLVSTFQASQEITIEDGDDASQQWMGKSLGKLPVFAKGMIKDGKMNAVILIDMSNSDFGVIKVLFGDDAANLGQIANSGMENFHQEEYGIIKKNKGMEPNAWHSFLCCDGLASALAATAHTEEATDVRPGSTGTKSVKIFSKTVFGKSANGTITTGRITAGSADPANTGNHASADMTNTSKDANGDPFYAALVGMPDSIEVWMKYLPKDESTQASLSAVVTDGTYYQDPEDKEYTNVVAKASNTAIAKNGGEWQLVKVPFDTSYAQKNFTGQTESEGYNEDSQMPAKNILVTISTCAVPAGGSTDDKNPDVLYVDDVRLTYGCTPTAITYKGETLTGFDPEMTEYAITGEESVTEFNAKDIDDKSNIHDYEVSVTKTVNEEAKSMTVYYTLISGDYQNTKTYAITYTQKETTGIDNAKAANASKANAIYDLSGRRVKLNGQHGVYIVRTAEGKTVKMYK